MTSHGAGAGAAPQLVDLTADTSSSSSDSSFDYTTTQDIEEVDLTTESALPPVPWNDALIDEDALRDLKCPLCHVVTDNGADMRKHLDGQRHLAAVTKWRETHCKEMAQVRAALFMFGETRFRICFRTRSSSPAAASTASRA